ncbi:MAG: DUF5724 domain-containing protein [Planctomycetes bacterium]|nr:DUF5724 domain-containing protein [Planctomycetota bacterium]
MLKPEAAREQIGKLQSKKHLQARFIRLKKLPRALAELGHGVFGKLSNGKSPSEWKDRRKLERASALKLSDDDKGRAKILAALFPTMHADVEAGWQLKGRLPYTVNYDRRAFRAPALPAVYAASRQNYLESLVNEVGHFPDDVLSATWLASWAVHLGYQTDEFGYLLAGVIDVGGENGDEVLSIVKDSAANRHDIGGPGGHATRALLCCGRKEAWEFTENLLLAAQRQEGLRQSILEAVDEAHPEAFQRMVGVVLDNNLIRFSSVARAASVWFGEEEAVENPKKLKADLQACRDMLSDSAARTKAVTKGDAARAYRGLWAIAFENVEEAVKAATPLLRDKAPARRFAAAKLLTESGLPEANKLLLPLLEDTDERLVCLALNHFENMPTYDGPDEEDEADRYPKDLFARLEKLIPSLPAKSKTLKPLVPGWTLPDLDRSDAAALLLSSLGKLPAERLLPYLPMMDEYRRAEALAKLCETRTLTTKVRQTLLAIAGEPSTYVREAALKHLKKCKLAEDEVATLEGYLTRKTADFRRSVFELLLNRSDKLVVGSIDRLLAAGDANRRGAGIELARRMINAERMAEPIRERLRDYREEKGKRLTTAEADAIEIVLNPASRPPTLADGLGLYDPEERTPVVEPKKRNVKFSTPAAIALLKELDDLIHEHRDKTFVTKGDDDEKPEEKVLGSINYSWEFPSPNVKLTAEQDRKNLPLLEIWEAWWQNRSARTRDADGFELLRAVFMPKYEVREGEDNNDDDDDDDDDNQSPAAVAFRKARNQVLPKPVPLRYDDLIGSLLQWFEKLYPPVGVSEFLLNAAETALAHVPPIVVEQTEKARPEDEEDDNEDDDEEFDYETREWRDEDAFTDWLQRANSTSGAADWTPEHSTRLFKLSRWLDEPTMGRVRKRPALQVILAAYKNGAATLADIYDHVIGPRETHSWGASFDSLESLTSPSAAKDFPLMFERPELRGIVEGIVARIIESELTRGETPTPLTPAANDIKQVHGMATLFKLIAALGNHGYGKNSRYSPSQNKPAVLTQLIRHCIPSESDTPAAFTAAVKAAVAEGLFPIERIAELGLVNPRWVTHVSEAIGWPGYDEAVYWFIAHVGSSLEELSNEEDDDDDDDDDTESKEEKPENPWRAIVKARTNLTSEQLSDGLIDVAWFNKAYAAVADHKRWEAIEAAAKFLGYGQEHKKAMRLADVLLGKTKKKDLVDNIRKKFLKESVRLLGLLPLPTEAAKRQEELIDRYKVLKEYERYASRLSSLSKEPAMQAARLGMENLAVTAGYPDPVRLEWAVTASDVADLAAGAAKVSVGPVSVSLALTEQGEPEITQTKAGNPLLKLPPDVKKNPKVAAMLDRKKALARTVTHSKRSLEQAMCASSRFTGEELKSLMAHPLVRPLLERLVLKSAAVMGYPTKAGTTLKSHDGKSTAIKATDEWTIAHPLDFVASKDWSEWQAECFRVERVQPFKQVFREVYVPTAAELEDIDRSRRYSGQQVNERQGNALFATRGWSTREGIDKLFRDAKLMVEVSFDHGYTTPADAASPAVSDVIFRKRDDWKPLKLTEVPPVIFSEVMRDLDLVVSVAHVGGVDPEATQSTTEMRAALLETTCSLLKLPNVKIEGRHVLIQGEYGKYSVHLGSAVVHKQPGGSLCVVPVNAQHRGRLFLPFADDDPRTAEVVSKVLLLARDKEIQDPTILQQIVAK